MKNVLICASMLAPILVFAQEKDSTNTKKDREYSNKIPLKAIENQ
ncbi:hypothetical protein [Chryseobacterium sp.]|nr:hypothetical protein [Chryseobacterium sp.]